ncbi:nucleoside 2-deoxyribosyltransferase [Puniceibacterium sediminis]|uniref:Nucleoside 2-deoxyribosyltransferase n=1 Tax=Puniceibacterium sediminis TaxID=1608407 RepID=A0A238ZUT6_9RHOB|nr:nucleoside 2-deoxyribosyltransferase [Puniceibacterium sediminis]SNR86668.1 Nucleoside 2-deoxyribosyltransferase [Puniceibacterium sediminis]
MRSIYLAGPDVFYPDGAQRLAAKADMVRAAGYLPIHAGVMAYPECDNRFATGCAISAVNELCLRGADILMANLTPLRGVGADTGTVFELAFMAALNRPIFGYTEDSRPHLQRIRDHYQADAMSDADGVLRSPDGLMVEHHDMTDNLMIDGAVSHRLGRILRPQFPDESPVDVFSRCLEIVIQKDDMVQRRLGKSYDTIPLPPANCP